jgi:hypothetical protein
LPLNRAISSAGEHYLHTVGVGGSKPLSPMAINQEKDFFMSHAFWQSVAQIPWWIYAFFVIIIRMGFYAKRNTLNLAINKLIAITLLFFISSFILLYLGNISFTLVHMALWGAATVAGCLLGWLQYQFLLKVKADKKNNTLQVKGSWSILIVGLAIFAVKWFDQFNLNPTSLLLIFGLLGGLLIGRLGYGFYCLKHGPYIDISITTTP